MDVVPVRRFTNAIALVSVTLLGLAIQAPSAFSAPGDENEGTTPSVRQVFDTALRDYNNAKGRLDISIQRQASLENEIKTTGLRIKLLEDQANSIANAAYRGSKITMTMAILDGSSPDSAINAASIIQYMMDRDSRQIRKLINERKSLDDQQQSLTAEVKSQQDQLVVMAKKKKDAEDALKRAGGGQLSAGVVPGQATAKPAARNPDGSWPPESCNQPDPTTSGCLTPRTLHAYNEVRLAGYTRHTSCFRSGGSGEHPKGRACDFAPFTGGFLNAIPSGDDKLYGDRLAGWLIANASRLGVLYVIWFKQIWFPGQGWRAYSGDGTPSGDHYNHVHLSMQ